MFKEIVLSLILLCAPLQAVAQVSSCRVVTSCGSSSYSSGGASYCTIDLTGRLCSSTSSFATYNATAPNLSEGQVFPLRMDSKGRLVVTIEKRATYSAAILGLQVASGTTDFFCVSGSASKVLIVKKIRFSGTASSTTQVGVQLDIRSSANTGGTSSTLTDVPADTTNPAGTATVRAYTVNPSSLGTLVGMYGGLYYTFVATNSNGVSVEFRELRFGEEEDQGMVLRGAAQSACLNLNGASLSGGLLGANVEWREISE